MKYKAIIFDLFGTLVPYVGEKEFNLSLQPLAEIFETDIEVVKDFWASPKGYQKAITEFTSTKERVIAFANTNGIDVAGKIHEAINSRLSTHSEWLSPKNSTLETLEKIKSIPLKIGMISECSAEVPELWESTLISKYIDVAVFSCIEHLNKSTIDIFQLCCDRLDISNESIIYVGDAKGEILMAQQIGMFPILMQTRKNVEWKGPSISEPLDVLNYIV